MNTTRRIPRDSRLVETLVSGRRVAGYDDLSAVVAGIQSLVPRESPRPTPALAALLANGLPPGQREAVAPAARPGRRRLRATATVAGVVAAMLGGLVGAAAANVLPDPLQRVVARAVEAVSPLHLPRPASGHPAPAGGVSQHDPQAPLRVGPLPTPSLPLPVSGPTATPTPSSSVGHSQSAHPQGIPSHRSTDGRQANTDGEPGETATRPPSDDATDNAPTTRRQPASGSTDDPIPTDEPSSVDLPAAPTDPTADVAVPNNSTDDTAVGVGASSAVVPANATSPSPDETTG